MSRTFNLLGNLLLVASIIAFVLLILQSVESGWNNDRGLGARVDTDATSLAVIKANSFWSGLPGTSPNLDGAVGIPVTDSQRPITRVAIARVALDAEVVPSTLVARAGSVTWEVPAFRVGHAQHTAGAGEPGNAVLLGHFTSRNAGNVFGQLIDVEVGDVVHVFSGTHRFEYQVVDARSVSRTDLSVVQSTETATITLITCAGRWLPAISDYAERRVVRAVLIE